MFFFLVVCFLVVYDICLVIDILFNRFLIRVFWGGERMLVLIVVIDESWEIRLDLVLKRV